ncbi:MAG: CapA family protein [Cyclobacteriaceae bacterium]|nr:CapA family protein [Cyclobacteriaceae bacterium]
MRKRLIILLPLLTAFITSMQAQDTARLSLLFLGDIMQHETQLVDAYNPRTGRYEYDHCFSLLKPYFNEADITIGNLELTLGGPPYKGYPQFSAPDALAASLKEAGVDVLVTANNHSVDRRRKGLERTIRVLDSLGFQYTGTFKDSARRAESYPLILAKHGVRFALLNYTYGTNGISVTKPNIVNLIDTAQIRVDINKARESKVDAIIVFFHWGDEYQLLPNREQKRLAAFCFDLGATLVIGAHPHVLQPMEWDKEKNQLVAYSLGNFVSGQRTRNRDGGGMLSVTLETVITDSARNTSISDASFRFQWVYKAAEGTRRFRVLPVSTAEPQLSRYVRDEASREAYRLFVSDSRQHLKKYNRNIAENTQLPVETITRYAVEISTKEINPTVSYAVPFGIDTFTDSQQIRRYLSGNFVNYESAVSYREKIKEVFPESVVVRLINGTISAD